MNKACDARACPASSPDSTAERFSSPSHRHVSKLRTVSVLARRRRNDAPAQRRDGGQINISYPADERVGEPLQRPSAGAPSAASDELPAVDEELDAQVVGVVGDVGENDDGLVAGAVDAEVGGVAAGLSGVGR